MHVTGYADRYCQDSSQGFWVTWLHRLTHQPGGSASLRDSIGVRLPGKAAHAAQAPLLPGTAHARTPSASPQTSTPEALACTIREGMLSDLLST